jgi:hypothetical protein
VNKTQRNVLVGFVAAISLTILFPPWQFASLKLESVDGLPRHAGYHFWFVPPRVLAVRLEVPASRVSTPRENDYDFSDLGNTSTPYGPILPPLPKGAILDQPPANIFVHIPGLKDPLVFGRDTPLDTVKARSLEAYLGVTKGISLQVDPVSGLEAKFIEARLDAGTLIMEWAAITLLSGALWLIFKGAPVQNAPKS